MEIFPKHHYIIISSIDHLNLKVQTYLMANEVQINNIDLPHNLEAEEAVLGSIIIDSDSLTKIMGELKVEHFFLYTNGFVYSACLSLFERQEAINQIKSSKKPLIIAGGGGWENNGVYTLKAVQNDLASEIEFKITA